MKNEQEKIIRPKGVSVAVCTYNGAKRLAPTFKHLAGQAVDDAIAWEVLLIDNNSTDDTATLAQQLWEELKSPVPLCIIREQTPGVYFARHRAYREAKYKYLLYVDDDNSLQADYVQTVYALFEHHPNIAIAVGDSELYVPAGFEIPEWWSDYASFYAVGSQGEKEGVVEERLIWTAGAAFRIAALYELYEVVEHELLLTGRLGEKQASGEDSELGFSLQLLGYDIYYTPKLKFAHHIDPQRINVDHLKQLNAGFGAASVVLDMYKKVLRGDHFNWTNAFRKTARSILRKTKNRFRHRGTPKAQFVQVNLAYSIARLRTLWAYRSRYKQLHRKLEKKFK
ncbi:MAG: glycosyltransferase [Bacteroidota bacterium]